MNDIGHNSGVASEQLRQIVERNFAPSSYRDASGRSLRAFNLTRCGFMLAAMSFSGRPALRWKVAYIEAFDAMEAEVAAREARQLSPIQPSELTARIDVLERELQAATDLMLERKPDVIVVKRKQWPLKLSRRQRRKAV
jgi:Rha family phage regulatory protein